MGEYDGSGSIFRRYVPGPGADQQGSIIAWSDQNGVAGASYAYGAYSEPLTPAGASAWAGSRFRYTGQIEISEAQLYHYEVRACDPARAAHGSARDEFVSIEHGRKRTERMMPTKSYT